MRGAAALAVLLLGAVPAPAAPPADVLPAAWFEKNVTVTKKSGYVHVFWNAQEARAALTPSRRRLLLARAARHLAVSAVPADADLVKLDVVFVSERDNYGMPRWDSLEKVGHLEFRKGALLAGWKEEATVPTEPQLSRLFTVFTVP